MTRYKLIELLLLRLVKHILKSFTISISSFHTIIGASLSEPHIDELNVRNLYINIIIIIIIIIMVRTSPARRYRDCTGVRDIFQHDLEAA